MAGRAAMLCTGHHVLRVTRNATKLPRNRTTPLWKSVPLIQFSCSTFSTSASFRKDQSYRLVVVGGGTAGSAISNKFTPILGKGNVAVIEPKEYHHYQPMWTLVGAGMKRFSATERREEDILPKDCVWIQDKVISLDPDNNCVTTQSGDKISYEFAVIAMGLQLNYHKIEGLMDALSEDPMVCSNYSPLYVRKTWHALQNIDGGNAIFTFPNTPIKCAGAPQKIAYLSDDYFRKTGKRDKINIKYNTSLGVIFGIPRYAAVLDEICNKRNVEVNKRRNLVKVDHKTKTATFSLLDSQTGETEDYQYSMLHVAPPMSTPEPLWGSALVDETNFVSVDRNTLRHTKYPNVFAMGDCSNAPTAKTAAAVAAQVGVVGKNLSQVIEGKEPPRKYDGYTSCPLITSYRTCIMAEFGYDGAILETFPFNQAMERRSMFHLKKDIMPRLYWHGLVRGSWHGPGTIRSVLSLGRSTK